MYSKQRGLRKSDEARQTVKCATSIRALSAVGGLNGPSANQHYHYIRRVTKHLLLPW